MQTNGGESAYPLHIKDVDQSGTFQLIGAALKIDIGRSAYSNVPRVWIDCGHALGWGSGFKVESRYFGNENQMERTVINGKMASKAALESKGITPSPNWKHLLYDEKSGYWAWE